MTKNGTILCLKCIFVSLSLLSEKEVWEGGQGWVKGLGDPWDFSYIQLYKSQFGPYFSWGVKKSLASVENQNSKENEMNNEWLMGTPMTDIFNPSPPQKKTFEQPVRPFVCPNKMKSCLSKK